MFSLSDRDKTPAPHGYGYYFYHTTPQRRVPCVLGSMLAPLSADDIPPITPGAMASVQAALSLLANLVGDRERGLYMGCGEAELAKCREEAQSILRVAEGLAGILRVTAPATNTAPDTSVTRAARRRASPTVPPPVLEIPAPPPTSPPHDTTPLSIQLRVPLSTMEITALTEAREHVRVTMAHTYSWETRDTAMEVLSRVVAAARGATPLALNPIDVTSLAMACEHVRVTMSPTSPGGIHTANTAIRVLCQVINAARAARGARIVLP